MRRSQNILGNLRKLLRLLGHTSQKTMGDSSKKKASTSLTKSSYAKVCRLVATAVHLMNTNTMDADILSIAKLTNPKPTASFYEFTYNMLSRSKLSLPVILISLKYLHSYLVLNTKSIRDHHLLITVASMTANKFLDDLRLSNSWWSRTSGIPIQQLNQAELLFLRDISYSLHLRNSEYMRWVEEMQRFGKWLEETGVVQQHLKSFPSPIESHTSSPVIAAASPPQSYMSTPVSSSFSSPTSSYRSSSASVASLSNIHLHNPVRTPKPPSMSRPAEGSAGNGSIDNFLMTQTLLLQLADTGNADIRAKTLQLMEEMNKVKVQEDMARETPMEM